MVAIREWKNYIDSLAERSDGAVNRAYMVANEGQLKEKAKHVTPEDCPILVNIIPTSRSGSKDPDNISENNFPIFFVLTFIARGDSDDQELDKWEITQQGTKTIKELIHSDYFTNSCQDYPFLKDIKFNSFRQEVEFNYLNFMGWSFSFIFETEGF